jgi:hypothetical protein
LQIGGDTLKNTKRDSNHKTSPQLKEVDSKAEGVIILQGIQQLSSQLNFDSNQSEPTFRYAPTQHIKPYDTDQLLL